MCLFWQIRLVCVTELASELLPVADRGLFQKCELNLVAGFCDRFQRIRLILCDGLVVAELNSSGTVVAGTDDHSLDIAGNDARVDKNLLHIDRILGDQFIICAVDMTLNSVQGQLSDVARKLVYEEIKIVYGTSVGNSCSDHYEVLSTAESNMNRMKLQDDTNGGNVDNLYSTVQQATSPIEPKVTKKSDDEPQEVNIEDQIAQFLNM